MPRLTVISTHPIQYHAPVIRCVQDMGVDVTVIYGSDFSVAGYTDQEFGTSFAWDTDLLSGYKSVFLSRVSEGGPKIRSDVTVFGLEKSLAESQPDAVLIPGYAHPFDRHAFRLAANRWPILLRAETTDHARKRSLFRNMCRDFLLRRYYSRCSRLLFIGQRSKNHYQRLGVPDHKLVFSPYCVDSAPFRPSEAHRKEYRDAVRTEQGIPHNAIVILYCGKLVERKGVDMLAPAAAELMAECSQPLHLLVVGDGNCLDMVRKQCAEHNVLVSFAGFQNQSSLSRYYHASDLMVFPSRNSETWGLTTNEALAHGIPCVVSDNVGCHPDLIVPGETGYVFDTGNSQQLASALKDSLPLTGNPDVRKICRDRVDLYSVSNAAKGLVSAMEEILTQPETTANR